MTNSGLTAHVSKGQRRINWVHSNIIQIGEMMYNNIGKYRKIAADENMMSKQVYKFGSYREFSINNHQKKSYEFREVSSRTVVKALAEIYCRQ